MTLYRASVAIVAGALTWSFLEYVIHRWLGHDARFRATPFGREHVRHHAEGNYFAPSWKKAAVAVAVVALLLGPALAFGGDAGVAYVLSFVLGYGAYELVHRRLHVSAGFGAYGRWSRRHHFTHHFVDARFNHGVTSPLWDLVFGTHRRVARITVPGKLCMSWLRDPSTGLVRGDWADTFELRNPR